jgi:N-formylmaleamate deformylase
MHDQYSALAGVEIHVSDTARHFIMWDDPQWMFGHLDSFLASK